MFFAPYYCVITLAPGITGYAEELMCDRAAHNVDLAMRTRTGRRESGRGARTSQTKRKVMMLQQNSCMLLYDHHRDDFLIVVGVFGLDVVMASSCSMEGVRRVPINGPIPRIIMVALADEEKITRTLA